jgi:dTDP-4-dehydrorhamnose 3,5-epimerase-like enzyme
VVRKVVYQAGDGLHYGPSHLWSVKLVMMVFVVLCNVRPGSPVFGVGVFNW